MIPEMWQKFSLAKRNLHSKT